MEPTCGSSPPAAHRCPSGCLAPKANDRWYLGSVPQWLHFESLSEEGAEKQERRKTGGRREELGETSFRVTQSCGRHHDWGDVCSGKGLAWGR